MQVRKRSPRTPHREPAPRALITAQRPFVVTMGIGGPLFALFGLMSFTTADDAIRIVLSLGILLGGLGSGVIAVIWLVENRRR